VLHSVTNRCSSAELITICKIGFKAVVKKYSQILQHLYILVSCHCLLSCRGNSRI